VEELYSFYENNASAMSLISSGFYMP